MMRIARYFFLCLGLLILTLSTSKAFMYWMYPLRDNDKWYGLFQYRHGNLASISYLEFLDKFRRPWIKEEITKPTPVAGNTALVMYGDSYVWSLKDSNFTAISAYRFISRYDGGKYRLAKTGQNILIIEIGEYMVRDYFNTQRITTDLSDSATVAPATAFDNKVPMPVLQAGYRLSIDSFFNKSINQNLQCNLFNYNWVVPMFGTKAALNYYLFHRGSGDVLISADGRFLFHRKTVDIDKASSTYNPLRPGEVDTLVLNFNAIYDHYRSVGFSEVYLSIVPSTPTIVQPDGYNGLIPAIQDNPGLRIKVIDMYGIFKRSKDVLFFTGDTHWNDQGKQIWVDTVNRILTRANTRNNI